MTKLARYAMPALGGWMLLLGAASPVSAQEGERELGWFNTTDFAFVLTGGNSETSTLGLGNVLQRIWETSELRVEAAGIRTESSLSTRTAVGSAGDFSIVEDKVTDTTAESYKANARYDRAFSGVWYGYGFGGWERNTFAGFDNRYTGAAGLGRQILDTERTKLKLDVGATYTVQKDVLSLPGADEGFGGLRLTSDFQRKISANTDFASNLVLDQSLDESDDLRADWLNSLSVAMSETLALRTSLRLLWDKLPSLAAVPLFDTGGNAIGETVLTPLDELDTFFTLALVVTL